MLEVERRLKGLTLTSLVLSMAFKMATLSFSREERTFRYSPRCGAKYSGEETRLSALPTHPPFI